MALQRFHVRTNGRSGRPEASLVPPRPAQYVDLEIALRVPDGACGEVGQRIPRLLSAESPAQHHMLEEHELSAPPRPALPVQVRPDASVIQDENSLAAVTPS